MNANEKIRARYRAREVQLKRNEERYRRDRANADDAATIRVMLHRVIAVDIWERKRFDQASAHIRADAAKRRGSYFAGLQAAVDQMRDRGETLAKIATLVEVDVREIQAALRRARTGAIARSGVATTPHGAARPTRSGTQDATTGFVDAMSDAAADRRFGGDDGAGHYDPTRCVRCDAVMLDVDDVPRRGRRRLYCSDTCRRDASAARTAAERYGSPIRVVEVPRAGSYVEQIATNAVPEPPTKTSPLDAIDLALQDDEALRTPLARVTEQARLKKLDRATLTAARELAKAVHPHRDW